MANEKLKVLRQPVGEAGDLASRAAVIEGFDDRLGVISSGCIPNHGFFHQVPDVPPRLRIRRGVK
jgi:hypothetical protein